MNIIKRNLLWIFYIFFVATALITHSDSGVEISGALALGKPIIWIIWGAFLIYTLSISRRENFFKSLKLLHPYLWHRQIGLDLYIGLLIPLTIIYLHEGSLLILLLWFAPIFIFANLATLLYLALNYESLVARFIS